VLGVAMRGCHSVPFTVIWWFSKPSITSRSLRVHITTPVANLLPAHFETAVSAVNFGLTCNYGQRVVSFIQSHCVVLSFPRLRVVRVRG